MPRPSRPTRRSIRSMAMWRGPEQNGMSRETGLIETFDLATKKNVLWSNPEAGGISTPIIFRGKLYTIVRHETTRHTARTRESSLPERRDRRDDLAAHATMCISATSPPNASVVVLRRRCRNGGRSLPRASTVTSNVSMPRRQGHLVASLHEELACSAPTAAAHQRAGRV